MNIDKNKVVREKNEARNTDPLVLQYNMEWGVLLHNLIQTTNVNNPTANQSR